MSRCLIKNKSGKCAKNVTIIGRRWFERTNGNTYHSTEVYVDGELIGKKDYVYGYDQQYLYTGFKIIEENGLAENKDAEKDYREDSRSNGRKFVTTVTDVERKRDL